MMGFRHISWDESSDAGFFPITCICVSVYGLELSDWRVPLWVKCNDGLDKPYALSVSPFLDRLINQCIRIG